MLVSVIQEQADTIVDRIKDITRGDWKVLVLDYHSKKIVDNVVREDDILNQNIANIELIEDRRDMNPGMDAIYLLSPEPHIVDCLLADLDRGRYKNAFLQMIAGFETLHIDYFPRESHLVTFRDPWSFPVLYHPACNNMVREHMQILAQKITGLCVLLGEFPRVRYYRPRSPLHEASVLCSHLARFVQEELDEYAQWNPNFPPQTSRPQGVLLITDRSMDLMAPIVHEFTYQAMAHDLLSIRDAEKVTYHMTINEGTMEAEEKDMELTDKDKVWVDNRHRHMKDTIDKLMGDFQRFLDQNPNFTNENSDTTSLNAIRDMLAGLPQFQEMKEAYSLHLTMAQECMNAFQNRKLPDIASVEQSLATGLDENFRKPKNILEEVAPLLDDDAVIPADRLRLIMTYILYRDGVIPEDLKRLLAHARLPPQDGEIITNLELLGAQVAHALKETRPAPAPLFPVNTKSATVNEEYALSRFQPVLKSALEEIAKGTLDQTAFPYVKPPLDPNEDLAAAQQGSLRAGRPNWASTGRRAPQNNQRIIVFVAGGATYSESRACYDVSAKQGRDVFLATSHMLTPELFIRQVGDLSRDKRRLDLPMDRPKPRAPDHLFERPAPPAPAVSAPAALPAGRAPGLPQQKAPGASSRLPRNPPPGGGSGLPGRPGPAPSRGPAPPTGQMSQMTLSSRPAPSMASNGSEDSTAPTPPPAASGGDEPRKHNKLEKKKRNFLGMKK